MNYRMISYILGWILIFEGLFLSVPMLTAIVYGESVLPSYLIAMGICFLIGGLLVFKKPKKKQLFAREGCVIVALSWIVLSAFGALPFLMTREIPTFIDALFETVSGFTTTGASILSDVAELHSLGRRHGRTGVYNGVYTAVRRPEHAHYEGRISRAVRQQAGSAS